MFLHVDRRDHNTTSIQYSSPETENECTFAPCIDSENIMVRFQISPHHLPATQNPKSLYHAILFIFLLFLHAVCLSIPCRVCRHMHTCSASHHITSSPPCMYVCMYVGTVDTAVRAHRLFVSPRSMASTVSKPDQITAKQSKSREISKETRVAMRKRSRTGILRA